MVLFGKHDVPLFSFVIIARFQRAKLVESVHAPKVLIQYVCSMKAALKKPFLNLITFLGRRIERRHFTEPPIYIGGCGRSGTTLLLSILSAHPKIFACPLELSMFDDLVDGYKPARMDRLYRTFLTHRIKSTTDRWCEKTPLNVNRLDAIDRFHDGLFRFINIVRDGRDVILSKHPSDPDRYWVAPERWINDVTAGKREEARPQVMTIRYEDLIEHQERTLEGICTFLNIEFPDAIRQWHQHTSVRKNRAYFGEVKPTHSSSAGKWKQPENQARAAELTAHPDAVELLEHYGYEI